MKDMIIRGCENIFPREIEPTRLGGRHLLRWQENHPEGWGRQHRSVAILYAQVCT